MEVRGQAVDRLEAVHQRPAERGVLLLREQAPDRLRGLVIGDFGQRCRAGMDHGAEVRAGGVILLGRGFALDLLKCFGQRVDQHLAKLRGPGVIDRTARGTVGTEEFDLAVMAFPRLDAALPRADEQRERAHGLGLLLPVARFHPRDQTGDGLAPVVREPGLTGTPFRPDRAQQLRHVLLQRFGARERNREDHDSGEQERGFHSRMTIQAVEKFRASVTASAAAVRENRTSIIILAALAPPAVTDGTILPVNTPFVVENPIGLSGRNSGLSFTDSFLAWKPLQASWLWRALAPSGPRPRGRVGQGPSDQSRRVL